MFNTLQSEKEKFNRQKISKDIVAFQITVIQLDIIDIYRMLVQQQNTYFSQVYIENSPSKVTFGLIKHILINLKE